ncbi:MAG: hypothetical protein R2759_07660 [Bacteroidales bacterium]
MDGSATATAATIMILLLCQLVIGLMLMVIFTGLPKEVISGPRMKMIQVQHGGQGWNIISVL